MAAAGANLVDSYLGVRYRVAGPVLYHIRHVGAYADPARPLAFVVRSRDGDQYEEDYAVAADYEMVVPALDHNSIQGVPGHQIYGWAVAPTAAERTLWIATANAIAAGGYSSRAIDAVAQHLMMP